MKTSPAHQKYAVAACLTAFTLAIASPASAATAEDDKTPLNLPSSDTAREAASSGGGGGGFARMIVGLAVVIAVIYGLSWVLKQVKASREGAASGSGLAQLSSLPLGQNRSLHLVRAGSELVLLGVAEKGVTPIRTYTEHEARAAGLLSDEELPALPAPGRNGHANGNGNGNGKAAGLIDALRQRTVRR
jgi:flagellar protein FliO/FliZ